MRLYNGERRKFARLGATCQETQVSLSGDEIIGEILSRNMALLPVAVSPYGRLGSVIERFLYGTKMLPQQPFTNRPHATAAAALASSRSVPRGVLTRANDLWRLSNPGRHYGGSYKAPDPLSLFDQELGLAISVATSSHILRAHNKNRCCRPMSCADNDDCKCSTFEVGDNPSERTFCTAPGGNSGCHVCTPRIPATIPR